MAKNEHCDHEGAQIETGPQEAYDDTGRRRIHLQIRCAKCKRLAIFCGVPNDGPEGPVAHTAGRVLSLPFEFQGSLM